MADAVAVGIDGGGTSTRVLIVDAAGKSLGLGKSGSGNLHDVGRAKLLANIDAAWRDAWAAAGAEPRPAGAAFCAMASVGTANNRATVGEVVAEIGVADARGIEVDIDLAGALAGGLGGQPGIALIAGTGSSCYGRDRTGKTFQSGGWGSLLDDVGGATWIGTQAMVAAIRAFDRRGKRTVLEGMIMEHLGIDHMRELLPKVDGDGSARAARAQIARLVTAAATDGDAVSIDILMRGADALAECAEAVWRTLALHGDDVCEVTVTGGIVEGDSAYRETIHAAIGARLSNAKCVLPRMTSVEGAAELARTRLARA